MTQVDEEMSVEVDSLRRELGEERLTRARIEERLAGAERAHKAEVLAREVVIADLRMALAEARRPWWRRWLS